MIVPRPSIAAALSILSACSLGTPEPIPLAGPTPSVVLIAPPTGAAMTAELAAAMLASVEPALRLRGYYAVPVETGIALLVDRGLEHADGRSAEELAAIADSVGADALLDLDVERWDADYAPTLLWLQYELVYRLWSAKDGTLLWELRTGDDWSWSEEPAFWDPGAALDEETGLRQREAFSRYGDDYETARAIHRHALASLPLGPVR